MKRLLPIKASSIGLDWLYLRVLIIYNYIFLNNYKVIYLFYVRLIIYILKCRINKITIFYINVI